MREVWVVVAHWCDDAWPVAAFATAERAEKRVHALNRLSLWANRRDRSWSRMKRGEWWSAEDVPFRDA
jgi:hypothetical protein